MDDANSAVKVVNSLWEQLTHAPSHLLLLLALLFLGMLIKKSPLPNWTIPWLLAIVGAIVYPLIASPTNMDPSFREGAEVKVLALYGFLLGIGTVVFHRWVRQFKWFQRIEAAFTGSYEEPKENLLDSEPRAP